MPNGLPDQSEVKALRSVVEKFIQERLASKLDVIDREIEKNTKLDKDCNNLQVKRQKILDDHRRETWVESAAKRVGQIQLVTHALKYTHANARGSSLYLAEYTVPLWDDALVGTHTVGVTRTDDVVGNAAALDVYKFLKLDYQDRILLKYILDRDPALTTALSDQPQQAELWVEQFASITNSDKPVATHTLAKQLYFPLPTGGYHLLAPLFPSSLVHAVYTHLQESRFSDAVKQARQAHKEEKAHPNGYREYPHMAMQQFGGTKPQNISQLNSERRGENWLLPSLPPLWRNEVARPPLGVTTIFGSWFGRRLEVRELTKRLAHFLSSTSYNNQNIRATRAKLVEGLSDALWQFAAEIQELPPGWSASPECKLDPIETVWLDPERAENDEAFAILRGRGNWQVEIASRFGNWLNSQLIYHSRNRSCGSFPLGSTEHREWQKVVIDTIKEELVHE